MENDRRVKRELFISGTVGITMVVLALLLSYPQYAGATSGYIMNLLLSMMHDVSITNPINGQVLTYNGTYWVNGNVNSTGGSGGNVTALDDLTDVALIDTAHSDILVYNITSQQWENEAQTTFSDTTACNNLGSGYILCAGNNVDIRSLLAGSDISIDDGNLNVYQNDTSDIVNNYATSIDTIFAEHITSSSALIGKTLSSMSLYLNSTNVGGFSATGQVGIWDSNANLVSDFGTIDLSTVTEGWYTFYPSSNHIIASNEYFGIDVPPTSGQLYVASSTSDVYDGADSHLASFYHISMSSWQDFNKDLSFQVTIAGVSDSLTIINTAPESTTELNDGHGNGNIANGGNVHFRGIANGEAIGVTQNDTDIIISNTGVWNNIAGTGITVNQTNHNVLITNSLPEVTACNNLGSGTILCSGGNINIKSIAGGTGITVSNSSTTVTITNTITNLQSLSNVNIKSPLQNGQQLTYNSTSGKWENLEESEIDVGGGTSLFYTTVGNILEFKTLLAGTGISLSAGSNTVTITNTGVISNSCSSGISCSGTNPSTFTNTGVIKNVASTGISLNATTGISQITNTGVISNSCTSPISCSGTNPSAISCSTCVTTASPYTSICSADASSGDTTMGCTGLTAHKYYQLFIEYTTQTSTAQFTMRFNSDSGNNYAYRYTNISPSGDTTNTSANGCNIMPNENSGSQNIIKAEIQDSRSGLKKGMVGQFLTDINLGATTAPTYESFGCSYSSTSAQITAIQIVRTSGTGTLTTDSHLRVIAYD